MKSTSKGRTLIIALLVLAMCLSLASCVSKSPSSSTPPSGGSSSAPPSGSTDPGTGEPETITMLLRERWAGVSYDNMVANYIQEQTNTKWDLIIAPAAELDAITTLQISSGEIPDFMNLSASVTNVWKYAQDGLLLDLSKHEDKISNMVKNHSAFWDSMKMEDGGIYAFNCNVNNSSMGVDFVPMYRKDWLDKFNLSIPTTIEEYYTVADAVSNQDPDGNGVKDTYALGGYQMVDMRYYDIVYSAFGVLPFNWQVEGDEIVFGTIHPNAREALRAMNKLYDMGALDPEFITDTAERNADKHLAGTYGALSHFIWIFDTRNKGNYYNRFKENVPNGEWVSGPILKGTGYSEDIGMRAISLQGWIWAGVHAKTEKLDAVLRVIDWMNTEEAIMYMNYGNAGEHYEYDAEGVLVPLVDDSKYKELGITQLYIAFNWLQETYSPQLNEAKEYAKTLSTKNAIDGLAVSPDLLPISTDLEEYTKTQYLRIITGEIDVDAGFDEMLVEWVNRGGNELTQAYNEAYTKKYG